MGTISSIIDKVKIQVEELKDLHKELNIDSIFSRVRVAKYYDFKKTRGIVLKEGDKICLSR